MERGKQGSTYATQGTSPLVWVSVLHWRGVEHTRSCLLSLRALRYPRFKVVLVDNGSADGDGESLRDEFPEVTLVRSESNLGFAGGSNLGITFALERGAEFIWLLNNDTEVAPDALSHLVEAAVRTDRAGAVSASLLKRRETPPGSCTRIGGGAIDFVHAQARLRPPAGHEEECEWLCGANLLLRAETIRDVGLLNEDYFLYYEDVEFCRRLRERGWKCLLVSAAEVAHTEGASTHGKHRTWRYYYEARNRLYFFSSYRQAGRRAYCTAAILLYHLRRALLMPLRRGDKRAKLRAEWTALGDFVRRRKGATHA